MAKLTMTSKVGVLLITAWVLFALTDMWFDIVSVGTFIKISISVFALFLLLLLLGLFSSKPKN